MKLNCKEGLIGKWNKLVKANQDNYGYVIIKAVVDAGKVLDEGKSPEEADDVFSKHNLSMFQAGLAAKELSRYHVRGEEFRIWWNKQFGIENNSGIVNPSVMYFKPKKE